MGNLIDVVPIVAILTKYVGAIIASLILGVLMIIARWKIFEKAGEPGWKSIIPIYSKYVYCRIVWEVETFWKMILYSFGVIALEVLAVVFPILALFSAVGTIVLSIMTLVLEIKLYARTAYSFGYGNAFAVGLVFLPYVFFLILAFNNSKYCGPSDY